MYTKRKPNEISNDYPTAAKSYKWYVCPNWDKGVADSLYEQNFVKLVLFQPLMYPFIQ